MSEENDATVSDQVMIVFYGDLRMQDVTSFINFFQGKGFRSVIPGEQGSSMCFIKKYSAKEKEHLFNEAKDHEARVYKSMYKMERNEVLKLREKVEELEKMMKQQMLE